MTKRGSPAVQVFIVVAVVGVFLYGFYLFHDKHTRLKRSEESAHQFKQKSESLSAQLQVLYEHKTRLENAVSQEKEIAKKAKDDLDVQKGELERKVDQQRNENAELTQQVESLQKKLDSSEAAATKASEDYKQLQQETEITIAKLKDEVANTKRRLVSCDKKTNQHVDDIQQDVDRTNSRINPVPRAVDESNVLRPDENQKVEQQDNMQVAPPNIANNQSLAVQDDFESQRRRPILADDIDDDRQQESKKLPDAAKDDDYGNDIERPQNH